MLLITALTDEGSPPLLWLLLLDFCLRSWSSSEAFSPCHMCVEGEKAGILDACRGYGGVWFWQSSILIRYPALLRGSKGSIEVAVQQKPLAGQKHRAVTQTNPACPTVAQVTTGRIKNHSLVSCSCLVLSKQQPGDTFY